MSISISPILFALVPEGLLMVALTWSESVTGAPRRDIWRNVQVWALQFVAMITFLPMIHTWAGPSLIDGSKLPFWAGFLIFLFVKDGAEFLFHYAEHRIPFMWAMHSLHHSDPEMGALTTQRHFWAEPMIKQLTVWSAALMIVSPTAAIFGAYSVAALWNLFSHADLKIDFGRWSWVINSPAYHRRHHSSLPEHYDQNFAGIFPIYDVILGTYHRPEGFPPTGLDKRPQSVLEMVIWPFIWDKPRKAVDEPVALPSPQS